MHWLATIHICWLGATTTVTPRAADEPACLPFPVNRSNQVLMKVVDDKMQHAVNKGAAQRGRYAPKNTQPADTSKPSRSWARPSIPAWPDCTPHRPACACQCAEPAGPKEEEPIAGMQDPDVLDARQEGEGRIHKRRGPPHQVYEDVVKPAAAVAAPGIIVVSIPIVAIIVVSIPIVAVPGAAEDAFQGLGELPAVEGVGDEVAPGLGHALEPAEGLEGDAGEDLHERVVGEPGHRLAPLGLVDHACAWW